MASGLPRMIRAAADRVPLIRTESRDAGTPFRLARAVIRGADWIRRTGRAGL
jgi:hypothetical protein